MTFTKEQTLDAIREVCTEQPDRTNPMGVSLVDGESSCLYLDANGNRCIGGEAVFRMTHQQIPATEFAGLWTVIAEMDLPFDAEAASLLGRTQRIADNSFTDDDDELRPHPRTWGEVLDVLEAELTEEEGT